MKPKAWQQCWWGLGGSWAALFRGKGECRWVGWGGWYTIGLAVCVLGVEMCLYVGEKGCDNTGRKLEVREGGAGSNAREPAAMHA